jgi:hypothetical protein
VAVVNEEFARRYWGGADPIGREIELAGGGPRLQVVGLARDIKYYSIGEPPRPYVYGPLAAGKATSAVLHVRAAGPFADTRRLIETTAASLDARVIVKNTASFAELRRIPLFPSRALAVVTGAFGALVLILTAVGIYGTIGFAVAQRTHEIGVRMAFGARPRDIFRTIIGGGLGLTALGVALGVGVSLVATRLLRAMLFGVQNTDPLTYAAVVALLVAAGALAAWLPARRAASIDPLQALRHE